MDADDAAEPRRRKHNVVTEDVKPLMTTWCTTRGYAPPDDSVFALLRANFRHALDTMKLGFGDDELQLRYIPWGDWRFDSLRRHDDEGAFWVSLDPLYAPDAHATIAINRVFDDTTGANHPGARVDIDAATPTGIAKQFGLCQERYAACGEPEEVIVVDDGAYSGGTLISVLTELDRLKIHATEVRLAFCTVSALSKDLATFFGQRDPLLPPVTISAGMVIGKDFLLDWVCERDFFIGVPRSGRTEGKIGRSYAEPHQKQGTRGLVTVGRPYLDRWSSYLSTGASITSGPRGEFSARLTDYSIRMWQAVEAANDGLRLQVKDLPRYPMDQGTFERNKDRNLIEFLEDEATGLGVDRKPMRDAGEWDLEE